MPEANVLHFLGYTVDELTFKLKPADTVDTEKSIELLPKLSRKIEKMNDENYSISIGVTLDQEDLPFTAQVSMTGRFLLQGIKNPEQTMKVNAAAILYPYVRAAISMLTTLANVPPVVLPPVNFVKLFEESAKEE